MSTIAGCDYSTRFVDVVLLDEDTDAATWHRFELQGQDAFERARAVRAAMPGASFWDDVVACGLEEPRGYGNGALLRVQGAVLACLPRPLLVQPWIPASWRKACGLPGNAPKHLIRTHVLALVYASSVRSGMQQPDWPQDACDAYAIAYATRAVLQHETEAA